MAVFDIAVEFVLENERGLVDNPLDPGGITNYGISLRFLRSLSEERLKRYGFFESVDRKSIEELQPPQAKMIYRDEFWALAPFEQIRFQSIGNYVFDCCINHGMGQGIKLLQRALWAANKQLEICVDDGILGDRTLALLHVSIMCLEPALIAERAGLMRLIAAVSSRELLLDGWLKRCYRI